MQGSIPDAELKRTILSRGPKVARLVSTFSRFIMVLSIRSKTMGASFPVHTRDRRNRHKSRSSLSVSTATSTAPKSMDAGKLDESQFRKVIRPSG